MVNAAVMLYICLSNKLKTRVTHCVDIPKASISLILFAVAQLKAFYPSDEKHRKDETIEEAFGFLKGTLSEWIADRAVIGGSFLGGDASASWKSKSKEELEVTILRTYSGVDTIFYCIHSCGSPSLLWCVHLTHKSPRNGIQSPVLTSGKEQMKSALKHNLLFSLVS